ncbi:hypothetical protein G7K_1434-t1 [Saitoella complicata NRRL Y-17804]|uniref:FAD-binding domain-containing protein n=2 Tax=Saitoella complicata (strain BCRC 22490 / CBS 7301 / JCM 7358 / NBRC 10748 / NRRL Y-17804) TaxID=698492 RepID=A0A0E9NBK9_SAICN|nr:hypothetical protein G7K_1434-t1 [Saitoella complicata NRRL Y-17804]
MTLQKKTPLTDTPLSTIIVGAGLGGLAAAISILENGHKVTILEQAPAIGEIGAGIQVPPNASRLLQHWGLDERMNAVSTLPQTCTMRRFADGSVLNVAPLYPSFVERFGAPYYHVHRADYHKLLLDACVELGAELVTGAFVTKVDFENGKCYTAARLDEPYEADLIIGADGVNSKTRECLLGPDPPTPTGDLAYRLIVPADKMKDIPELAEFVNAPAINFWLGPDCHVVGYLLRGGGLYNIVLLCPDTLSDPNAKTEKGDAAEMLSLFEQWDPKLTRMLKLDTSPTVVKWKLMNREEAPKWVHEGGRFALLGDAIHPTLPYLASGAAIAVEDGVALGELLGRVRSVEELPTALAIYERLRKPRTTRVVQGSTNQRTLFHMHDGAEQVKRDEKMKAMEAGVGGSLNPFEGDPNRWRDGVWGEWLYGYDVLKAVEEAWPRGGEPLQK